jgi:hypothetical protein
MMILQLGAKSMGHGLDRRQSSHYARRAADDTLPVFGPAKRTPPPPGVKEWTTFDVDVRGCHCANHAAMDRKAGGRD